MDLLGYDGFRRVGPYDRGVERQQGREMDLRGQRVNLITESNVDLHHHTRAVQACWHPNPYPLVLCILLDAVALNASDIENNTVVRRR